MFERGDTTSWEWQIRTGVYVRDVSDTQQLRLLECDLQLTPDPAPANPGRTIYSR